MKLMLFIHVFLVGMNRNDICQKHIMRAQRNDLPDLTFNIDRALRNHGRTKMLGRNRRQSEFLELIDITAALDAAVVCCKGQFLRRQVNHKLPRLF